MSVKDFFLFRRMLLPYLIQVIFWIGLLAIIVLAIVNFYHKLFVLGISTLILGPVVWRIGCEYIIVLFKIQDTAADIRELLEKNSK